MSLKESALILKLDSDELEELVKKWLALESEIYFDFSRSSGAYDRGLDAVGFLTKERHDGDWDNFQCKQLRSTLKDGEFFAEIGKVFYYASLNEFILPRRYIFVAPNGISKETKKFVNSPKQLKAALLDEWDVRCSGKIISKKKIPLSSELKTAIEGYDFSKIEAWNNTKLIEQPNVRKVLHYFMDVNPGSAPQGTVPADIDPTERGLINQLIGVYEDDCGEKFSNEDAVHAHEKYGQHLLVQRTRYYDAEAFHRHFRDNIDPKTLKQFNHDIYHAVIDEYLSSSGLPRVNAVMKSAGNVQVSGVFGKHNSAAVSVKQGVCHQQANIGVMPWKK
ncbi:hypothetical protein GCM10027565_43450 [Bordetella tumulicola]